ncbi:MAG: hypothetical protein AB7E48_06260 [Deferribacterales bacterium]
MAQSDADQRVPIHGNIYASHEKEGICKKTLEPTYQVKNHILCFSLTRSRRNKFGFASHGALPSMGAFISSTKKKV